jgi:hypothetical protein
LSHDQGGHRLRPANKRQVKSPLTVSITLTQEGHFPCDTTQPTSLFEAEWVPSVTTNKANANNFYTLKYQLEDRNDCDPASVF